MIHLSSFIIHSFIHLSLFFVRVESLYDVSQLKDLFNKAKFARCRSRFVVPVILLEGKVSIMCYYSKIAGKYTVMGYALIYTEEYLYSF